MNVDLQVLMGFLATFTVVVGGVVAGVIGIYRWVRKIEKGTATKKEVGEVEKQVKTSNGNTLGEIVEKMAEDTSKQFIVLTHIAESNSGMIEQIAKRLDEHMTWGGHHDHDKSS